MTEKQYPEIDRVIPTESGLVRGVAGGTPQYTVFKGIPYAAPPWGTCDGKSPSLCPPGMASGTPPALAPSRPSTGTLWAPFTATSFSAAPSP